MSSEIDGILIHPYDDIDHICDPLRRLGISYFSYTCVYNDGTRLDYNNNPDMTDDYYLKKKIYEITPLENPAEIESGIIIWSSFPEDLAIMNAKVNFDVTNGVSIIQKESEYAEMIHLGATEKNLFTPNFIINNLSIMQKFVFYFKDKISSKNKLELKKGKIHVLTGTGITRAAPKVVVCPKVEDINLFLEEIKVDRYRLGPSYNNQFLTNREVECLRWSCLGKSSAEIGMIVGISPRTVEEHIRKVKEKLGCYKQTMMVKVAYDLGIIF